MKSLTAEDAVQKAAWMIAVRCRAIIQGLLRDEEQGECDREFAAVAEEVLRELAAKPQPG